MLPLTASKLSHPWATDSYKPRKSSMFEEWGLALLNAGYQFPESGTLYIGPKSWPGQGQRMRRNGRQDTTRAWVFEGWILLKGLEPRPLYSWRALDCSWLTFPWVWNPANWSPSLRLGCCYLGMPADNHLLFDSDSSNHLTHEHSSLYNIDSGSNNRIQINDINLNKKWSFVN